MHVQIITFGLEGLSDEEYHSHCETIASAFAQLPGLVSKTWLANAETNTYGGVYLWRDRRSMENYERSDIYRGMLANPRLEGIAVRSFPIVEAATEITSNLAAMNGAGIGPRLVRAPGGAALLEA
jgi:hypothetical protein